MRNATKTMTVSVRFAIATTFLSLITSSHAVQQVVDDTTISSVIVNGGADTANPGVTCIRITSAVSAACPNGIVGIPNNNKLLVAAALLNKATSSKIWLYYADDAVLHHCAGQVLTPCSVISIESK